MPLSVYNTLSRSLEAFEPKSPPDVTLYACGPTVYGHVHIGNWSAFVFGDILVRWLRESGYGVRYVMNITDVEDKIIRNARAAGEDRKTFTDRWTKIFFDDMQRLQCERPDELPRATDHVAGMAGMIQALLDAGHAYMAEDGSIYYRVTSFEGYGELAGIDPSALQAGASGRVHADEYEKDQVADFALWKAYTEEDGDVFWEPTFRWDGREEVVKGRPGWHIECSVMSTALLGEQIDVHLGGEDLVFPHHQNEIAQSEGATGKRPFVRYWMHRKHLLVGGGKMSRSKKNFYTLKDLIEREGPFAARAFRYMVASSHYRSNLDFSWTALDAARKTLRNLDDAYKRLQAVAAGAEPSAFAHETEEAFDRAMNNDLQTPVALAAVQALVGECNRRLEAATLSAQDAASALALLGVVDRVLGLTLGASDRVELTAAQEELLAARARARAEKDWAASDRLRDELAAQGIAVKDAGGGQEVSYL